MQHDERDPGEQRDIPEETTSGFGDQPRAGEADQASPDEWSPERPAEEPGGEEWSNPDDRPPTQPSTSEEPAPEPREDDWPRQDLEGVPREAESFDGVPPSDGGPTAESTDAHAVPATSVGESTTCQRCGAENRPGVAFCRNCGQRLAPASPAVERPTTTEGTEACPRCGTHNRAGVAFCQNCGANLRAPAPAPAGAEAAAQPATARRGAVLGPVVLLIGAVGMVTAWLLPFRYGTDSLWDRSFGAPGGFGAAFWQAVPDAPIIDQAYFSLAAAAPLLVALLVLLAIGGFVRAAPGPIQLIGLVLALIWAIGLIIGFAILEVAGGWAGDLTALLRELSPAGIIFFLASWIVVIGSLTRFARS